MEMYLSGRRYRWDFKLDQRPHFQKSKPKDKHLILTSSYPFGLLCTKVSQIEDELELPERLVNQVVPTQFLAQQ